MFKKKLALALTASLILGSLTGCGDSVTKEINRYAGCCELGDYIGVEYVAADRTVSEDDVEYEIEEFCEDNAVTEEDYDSAVADGDTVNIDFVETISGEEEDSDEGYEIVIGDEYLVEGLDEQIIGMLPGETATLTVTYDEDYDDETLAGMEAEFEITVNYISVTTVPEYTDDLVNEATDGEYTTTDEYTAYIRQTLQDEVDADADDEDRESILNAIIENTTFTQYPEWAIEEYITGVMGNIEASAESYGIDVATLLYYFYGYSVESDFLDYLKEVVESVMQERIVVCAMAVELDLLATDDDISDYKTKLIEEDGYEEEDIESYYSDFDLMFYATEEKLLEYLETVSVAVEDEDEDSDEEDEEASDEEEDDDDDSYVIEVGDDDE